MAIKITRVLQQIDREVPFYPTEKASCPSSWKWFDVAAAGRHLMTDLKNSRIFRPS